MGFHRFNGNTQFVGNFGVFFIFRAAQHKDRPALRRQLIQHLVYFLFPEGFFFLWVGIVLRPVVQVACAVLVFAPHRFFFYEINTFVVDGAVQVGPWRIHLTESVAAFPYIDEYCL